MRQSESLSNHPSKKQSLQIIYQKIYLHPLPKATNATATGIVPSMIENLSLVGKILRAHQADSYTL